MITPGRRSLTRQDKDLRARPDVDLIGNQDGEELTGFVIVRLTRNALKEAAGEDFKNLQEATRAAGLDDLARVLDEYELTESRRSVHSVSAKTILDLEARAQRSELPPLRSLTSYWKIDARKHFDRVDEILKALLGTRSVDTAYIEHAGSDPAVNAADDTYKCEQLRRLGHISWHKPEHSQGPQHHGDINSTTAKAIRKPTVFIRKAEKAIPNLIGQHRRERVKCRPLLRRKKPSRHSKPRART